MIYLVDEQYHAHVEWLDALRQQDREVTPIWSADAAFRDLRGAAASEAELVVIDVMLAVEDAENDQFSATRTQNYDITGLCLLEDLATVRPAVFPDRAVLLTSATTPAVVKPATALSEELRIPLWRKWEITSAAVFAQLVLDRIAELAANGRGPESR